MATSTDFNDSLAVFLQETDPVQTLQKAFEEKWETIDTPDYVQYHAYFDNFRVQIEKCIHAKNLQPGKVAMKRFVERVQEFQQNKEAYDGYHADIQRWVEHAQKLTRKQAKKLKSYGAWRALTENGPKWPAYRHQKGVEGEYKVLKNHWERMARRLERASSVVPIKRRRVEVEEK